MEIGCGARVRDFDGRQYFYFWHYERTNGRSERKEDYIGRVDAESARSDLLRRMAVYHRKAEQEFARRRARIEGLIEAAHTSTWRYVFLSAPWSASPLLRGGECLSPFVGSSTRAPRAAALRRIRPRR